MFYSFLNLITSKHCFKLQCIVLGPVALVFIIFFVSLFASGNCSAVCFVALQDALLKEGYVSSQPGDKVFSDTCSSAILSSTCVLHVAWEKLLDHSAIPYTARNIIPHPQPMLLTECHCCSEKQHPVRRISKFSCLGESGEVTHVCPVSAGS